VLSDWSENDWAFRPVASDWSGGVGMVSGMKRRISEVDLSRVEVQIGDPTSTIYDRRICSWTEGCNDYDPLRVTDSGRVLQRQSVRLNVK